MQTEVLGEFYGGKLKVLAGDICAVPADAIVNAANSSLLGGGGVDGAIHKTGGPEILAACRSLRSRLYPQGLPAGEAAITTAGRLPAKWVIHTVGPVWQGGGRGEEALLAAAYRNSLRLAAENGVRSIAFPAVSTGVYGFPKERAAEIVREIIAEHLENPGLPEEILLVYFSRPDAMLFLSALKKA